MPKQPMRLTQNLKENSMTPEELKEWRTELGMSQIEFGQYLSPTRTPIIISKWERGVNDIPQWVDNFRELVSLRDSM